MLYLRPLQLFEESSGRGVVISQGRGMEGVG